MQLPNRPSRLPLLHAITILLIIMALPMAARGQGWEWARSGGGLPELDGARGAAVDGVGNYYVTGYFSGNATISGTSLESRGGTDVFIASYTPDGTPRWVKRAGSARDDYGMAITVDQGGNIYFTGMCGDSADFEDSVIVAREPGGTIYYIVSYRADLTVRWTQRIDGGSGFPMGISVNNSGYLAVTGYGRRAQFTDDVALLMVATDIFTAVYTTGGAFQWARGITANALTEGIREGRSVVIDDQNNVFITGYIANGARFDEATVFFAEGIANLFVARYDAGGTFRWVWKAGGPNYDVGTGIALNDAGELYVTGYYQGPIVVAPGDTLPAENFLGDIFLARFDTDGALVWVRTATGRGRDEAGGISIASNGDLVIGGLFSATTTFGADSITSVGSSDLFIARYRTNGDFVGVIGGGGPGEDFGYGVAAGSGGGACVVGSFQESATFGSTTLNSQGGTDIAVAGGRVAAGAIDPISASSDLQISIRVSHLVIDNRADRSLHGRLRVVNTIGETLYEAEMIVGTGPLRVGLDHLPAGCYLIDLDCGPDRHYHRLLVKRD